MNIDENGHVIVILNDNVDGKSFANGEFWLQTANGWANDLAGPTPRTIDLTTTSTTSTLPGSVVIPAIVPTPTPSGPPTPTPGVTPGKYSNFSNGDQGRTQPNRAITFDITAPFGPSAGAVLTDTIPAGAGFEFDCATFQKTQASDTDGTPISVTWTCSPTELVVTVGPYKKIG